METVGCPTLKDILARSVDTTTNELIFDCSRNSSGGALRFLEYALESQLAHFSNTCRVSLILPKSLRSRLEGKLPIPKCFNTLWLSRPLSFAWQIFMNFYLLISRGTMLVVMDATTLTMTGRRIVIVQDLLPWSPMNEKSLSNTAKLFFQRLALRSCDMVLFSSDESARIIGGKVRLKNSRKVHFGSPSRCQDAYARALRTRIRSGQKGLIVCYSTTHYSYKNVDIFIVYVGKLMAFDKSLNIKAMIIGLSDIDSMNRIGSLCESMGISDKIEIIPHSDFESYCRVLAEADVAVNFSLIESFGYFLVDYVAMGLPILSVNYRYARDAIGDHGDYFNIDNFEEFRHGIYKHVTPPERKNLN
jgi:glycosyltransferase involved in cell wall biosynthesis